MRFSCEGCSAKYMISDDKVGPVGVKVRCKKCGHVTHVRRGEPEGAPAPGGALAAEWWAAIGDQPVGPVGIDVLQHHWDRGEIGPESLVWYSGLAEWTPLSSVPELHSHLGGMPVAPPAPTPTPAQPPAPSPALDDEWRPGAASALAALDDHQPRDVDSLPREPASAAVAPPAAEPVPSEGPGIGTDPTGVVPLPMAGLERTGEKRIPARPGARGNGPRTPAPAPPESRSLTVVLLVALVVVAAVAVGLWWMTK